MGVAASAQCSASNSNNKRSRIQVLEQQLRELRRARAGEARTYEQQATIFARREEEWREEKKKCEEEVARLKKKLEEEEQERVNSRSEINYAAGGGGEGEKAAVHWQIVEKMKVEQARREEAVEKWKQLYHAIKVELDDLIQTTLHQGERLEWASDQGVIEGLERELKAKEMMLENLKSRIAAMEKDTAKKDREIDILKQSLRILSNSKRNRSRKKLRGLRSRITCSY